MQFQFITDARSTPIGAKATLSVPLSEEAVIARVSQLSQRTDLHTLLDGIPMIKSLTLRGDVAAIAMQFKVAFLSVNFGVRGKVVRESDKVLRFDYEEGEPTDTQLRFELSPGADGGSVIHFTVRFDLDSLGFVAKYFLKHHPEIRPGVFAGVAYSVADSLARRLK